MRALIFANIRQKSCRIHNSLCSQAFAVQCDTPFRITTYSICITLATRFMVSHLSAREHALSHARYPHPCVSIILRNNIVNDACIQTWQITHLPAEASFIITVMPDDGQMVSTFTNDNQNDNDYLCIHSLINWLLIDLFIYLFIH